MGLVSTNVQSGVNAPKQIAISGTGAASDVVYTVPVGRKFIGKLGTNDTTYAIVINGQNFYPYNFGATGTTVKGFMNDVVLVAGTTVANSSVTSATVRLLGVEYDA